jgi:hypothetical protein
MSTTARIVPFEAMHLLSDFERWLLEASADLQPGLTRQVEASSLDIEPDGTGGALVEAMALQGPDVLEPIKVLAVERDTSARDVRRWLEQAYPSGDDRPQWVSLIAERLHQKPADHSVLDVLAGLGINTAEILQSVIGKPANHDREGNALIPELVVYQDDAGRGSWPMAGDPAVVRITPGGIDIVTVGDAYRLLKASEELLGRRGTANDGQRRLVETIERITHTSTSRPPDDFLELRVERLAQRMRELGVDVLESSSPLEEMAFDTASGAASAALNGDLEDQLRFLLEHGVSDAEVEALIRAMVIQKDHQAA